VIALSLRDHAKAARRAAALGAIALASTGLAACGGSSSPVVAQVAGVGSISEATLNHWVPIEATLLYSTIPGGPVPKGVLPDPPSYSACIALLGSKGAKLVESGPKPTKTQLKSHCVARLQELKELALNILIGWDWTIGEGQRLGIKLTSGEIKQRFVEVNHRLFPKEEELTHYIERTGQTVSDLMFRAKVQLFEVKNGARVRAAAQGLSSLPAAQRQAAILRIDAQLPPSKSWAAKTSCRAGFVVSACKQYRGSSPPGLPN
jgi:foldase protein PrsA